MLREDDFSRLELNLPNCMSNYRYFRGRLERETKLLVLVKANAYGHGAVEFASMMQQAGADYLAVALPVEGVELRRAGISLPILVLTAGTDFFAEIIENRLEPGIPNLFTLKAFYAFLSPDNFFSSEYSLVLRLFSSCEITLSDLSFDFSFAASERTSVFPMKSAFMLFFSASI